jgi:hypothetical protein
VGVDDKQRFGITHFGGLAVRQSRNAQVALLTVDIVQQEVPLWEAYMVPRTEWQRNCLKSMAPELPYTILALGQADGTELMQDLRNTLGNVRPKILCRWGCMSKVVQGIVGASCIVWGCREPVDTGKLGSLEHLCSEHCKVWQQRAVVVRRKKTD